MPEDTSAWRDAAKRLTAALHLTVAPIAITFGAEDAPPFAEASESMPEPTADVRTARVPAGCVFWVHALERTFTTKPEDHENCSVGSFTHGLIDLANAATRADVGSLVEAGWVTPEVFSTIPTLTARPSAITYGPLADAGSQPDVVLLRSNAKGIMTIGDAIPDLAIEGKPQCHIVAIAREQQRAAASVGCALSRVRTGMGAQEMTCALPGLRLEELVVAIESAASVDTTIARYAAVDAQRFSVSA